MIEAYNYHPIILLQVLTYPTTKTSLSWCKCLTLYVARHGYHIIFPQLTKLHTHTHTHRFHKVQNILTYHSVGTTAVVYVLYAQQFEKSISNRLALLQKMELERYVCKCVCLCNINQFAACNIYIYIYIYMICVQQ